MSLNKKLDEQTRGFKFCFLFKPFNKHLGTEHLDPIPLLLVHKHLLLTMLQRLFYDIPISH